MHPLKTLFPRDVQCDGTVNAVILTQPSNALFPIVEISNIEISDRDRQFLNALSSIFTSLFNVIDEIDRPSNAELSMTSTVVPEPMINSRSGNVENAWLPILWIWKLSSMKTRLMLGADPKHSDVMLTKTSRT